MNNLLNPSLVVLIPIFNEEKHIGHLIETIRSQYPLIPVMVADDGSTDAGPQIVKKFDSLSLLNFYPNQGKGNALFKGIKAALEQNFEWVITMDGDGQHSPLEISKFIEEAKANRFDLVLGQRQKAGTRMPYHRKLSNFLTSWLISKMAKQKIFDSQSGYRLYRTACFKNQSLSNYKHFEWESKIIIELALQGYKIGHVPISTIYTDEKSHINLTLDTFRFLKMLIRK